MARSKQAKKVVTIEEVKLRLWEAGLALGTSPSLNCLNKIDPETREQSRLNFRDDKELVAETKRPIPEEDRKPGGPLSVWEEQERAAYDKVEIAAGGALLFPSKTVKKRAGKTSA
jgi:hypothetical protein